MFRRLTLVAAVALYVAVYCTITWLVLLFLGKDMIALVAQVPMSAMVGVFLWALASGRGLRGELWTMRGTAVVYLAGLPSLAIGVVMFVLLRVTTSSVGTRLSVGQALLIAAIGGLSFRLLIGIPWPEEKDAPRWFLARGRIGRPRLDDRVNQEDVA